MLAALRAEEVAEYSIEKRYIKPDGKIVWVYDPDLEQVTIRKLDLDVGETPVLLLLHPEKYLIQRFTVTEPTPDELISTKVEISYGYAHPCKTE